MAVKYNLPPDAYTPVGITYYKAATPEAARKEYQRLRRIANKRLDRLAQSEFSESAAYTMNKDRFRPLAEISNDKELGTALTDVRRFLDAKRSSISGQKEIRKKAIKTLHEHGYYMVNEENFEDWGQYMEAVRMKSGADHVIGSPPGEVTETAADLFEAAERKGIPPEEIIKDWDYWTKNVKGLEEAKQSRKEGASAKDYKRNIEAKKRRLEKQRKEYEMTRSRVLQHNAAQHKKMQKLRRKG